MVGTGVHGEPDPEAVVLTGADAAEVLDLVDRTEPGPFRKRTVELGRYLGIRRDGPLVAMAGERLRVPGYTEISAVCTDPAYRGQGLAARLTRAVAARHPGPRRDALPGRARPPTPMLSGFTNSSASSSGVRSRSPSSTVHRRADGEADVQRQMCICAGGHSAVRPRGR